VTVMKRLCVVMTIAGMACACALEAQTPTSLATEAKQAYNAVKNNILKSAEKMSEENYAFKPTPEIRSFAEVLDHVADAQMRTCAAVAGDEKTVSAMGKTSKADVMAALNAAFAECDKAYDSLTDANLSESIKTGRGQRSKLGALVGNTTHDNEQYGIMTVYMRLKGIVPPSSDRSSTGR
jgi:uncharacterized damage-inducible protein DinB